MLDGLFNRIRYRSRPACETSPGFVPLQGREIEASAPPGPGVYMLAFRTGRNRFHTFHIGETANLHACLTRLLRKSVAYHIASSASETDQLEFYFITFPLPVDGRKCRIELIFAAAINGEDEPGVVSTN